MNAAPGPWQLMPILVFSCGVGLVAVVIILAAAKRLGLSGLTLLAGCFMIVAIGFLLAVRSDSLSQPATLTVAPAVDLEGAAEEEEESVGPASWDDIDLQQFSADVYPGETTAVEALAYRVRRRFDEWQILSDDPVAEVADAVAAADDQTPAAGEPVRIVIREQLPASEHIGNAPVLAKHIQPLFPHSQVVSVADSQSTDPNSAEQGTPPDRRELLLVLRHFGRSETIYEEHAQPMMEQSAGRIECSVAAGNQTAIEAVDYISKPWLEHFDMFVSGYPERRLIVGYSPELVSSEQEARRQAIRNARNQFAMVVDGVIVRPDGSHVLDRFAQKLSRPYGDVWREAVLMDVSPHRMQPRVATIQREVRRIEQTRMSAAGGIVLLFGTTLVICLVLNWLTEGYYRGRLTLVPAVAVVLAIIVAVAILSLVG